MRNSPITAIRLVKTKPKRPYPTYKPDPNSWSTQGVEVSAPLNIYPEFRPSRSLFEAKGVDTFTVEAFSGTDGLTPNAHPQTIRRGNHPLEGFYYFPVTPPLLPHLFASFTLDAKGTAG